MNVENLVREFPPHEVYIQTNSRLDILLAKEMSRCDIVFDENEKLLGFFGELQKHPGALVKALHFRNETPPKSFRIEPLGDKEAPFLWAYRNLPLFHRLKKCQLEPISLQDFTAKYLPRYAKRRVFLYAEYPTFVPPSVPGRSIMVLDHKENAERYPGWRTLPHGEGFLYMDYPAIPYIRAEEVKRIKRATTTKISPALKWNGAKFSKLDWIYSVFPPHTTFVDVFGGSGTVLHNKPRSEVEIFNDLDFRVYNFALQMRDHPRELMATIWATPYSRKRPRGTTLLQQAANFCADAAQGINGLVDGYLATDSGGGRIHRWAEWAEKRIPEVSDRLQGVELTNDDWSVPIKKYGQDPNALLYCDPPYLGYEDEYHCKVDNRRLAEELKKCKCKVIVSERLAAMPLFEGWYYKATPIKLVKGSTKGKTACEYLYANFRMKWSRLVTKEFCLSLP